MKLARYKTNLVAHCLLTEKVMTSIYDVAYKLNNLKNDNSVLLLVSFTGLNPNLYDENKDVYCGVGIDFDNVELSYLVGKTEDKLLHTLSLDEKLEVLRLLETYYEKMTLC